MLQDEYGFSYAVDDVNTGNQFGHSENRFGVDTVGAYHVLLPDGRLQTVSYTGILSIIINNKYTQV